MKIFKDLKFELLNNCDIEELTPIVERAFNEDARIHLNESKGGPSGYNNSNFLHIFGLHKNSTTFKISLNDTVIGCIILWINKETLELCQYLGHNSNLVFLPPYSPELNLI